MENSFAKRITVRKRVSFYFTKRITVKKRVVGRQEKCGMYAGWKLVVQMSFAEEVISCIV